MTPEQISSENAGRTASGVLRVRRRGIGRSAAILLVVVLAALALVADQVTKAWAEAHLELHTPRPLVGELLQLFLLYNSGAAWGMGSGITPVITVVQIVIALGALVFVVRSVRSTWWSLALGLVIGGALGNIHDRLLRAPGPFRGEVVDFLQLPHWPVFNIADSCVVAGALLIVLLGVLGVSTDPAATSAEATGGTTQEDAEAPGAAPEDRS